MGGLLPLEGFDLVPQIREYAVELLFLRRKRAHALLAFQKLDVVLQLGEQREDGIVCGLHVSW